MWCLSSRGIKLRSESQPEQALQHVFKQKPTGRQAYRPQAAFSVPVSVMQHYRQSSIVVPVKVPHGGVRNCLSNPHLPVHSFCTSHQQL